MRAGLLIVSFTLRKLPQCSGHPSQRRKPQASARWRCWRWLRTVLDAPRAALRRRAPSRSGNGALARRLRRGSALTVAAPPLVSPWFYRPPHPPSALSPGPRSAPAASARSPGGPRGARSPLPSPSARSPLTLPQLALPVAGPLAWVSPSPFVAALSQCPWRLPLATCPGHGRPALALACAALPTAFAHSPVTPPSATASSYALGGRCASQRGGRCAAPAWVVPPLRAASKSLSRSGFLPRWEALKQLLKM